MNRRCLTLVLIGVMILAVGCGAEDKDLPAMDQQLQQQEAVRKTVQAFGVVMAKEVKGIMVDLPAAIERIHVQEGEKVKKGDTLLTLNLQEINAQIREKEDILKVTRLELKKFLEQLRKTSIEDTPEILQAKNELANMQNDLEQLIDDLKKKEVLFKEGAIAEKDIDDLKINVEKKQREVENSKLRLEKMKDDHKVQDITDELDVEIKKQNIESQQYSVQTLKDKVEQSGIQGNKIICDIPNGIVERINNAAGDRLNPEKQIMSIIDMDTLMVKANVPEDFIRDVKVGNEVEITPLAAFDKKYEGKVARVSKMAVLENGETVVPVEITFDNTDEFLIPNFNVNINIFVD